LLLWITSWPINPIVRQLLVARGCLLLFLPTYSPDFSPIEYAFAKMKQFLRRLRAQTLDTLIDAIATALDLIAPYDAIGCRLVNAKRAVSALTKLICASIFMPPAVPTDPLAQFQILHSLDIEVAIIRERVRDIPGLKSIYEVADRISNRVCRYESKFMLNLL
jgi:DDE superfamily endonuclease